MQIWPSLGRTMTTPFGRRRTAAAVLFLAMAVAGACGCGDDRPADGPGSWALAAQPPEVEAFLWRAASRTANGFVVVGSSTVTARPDEVKHGAVLTSADGVTFSRVRDDPVFDHVSFTHVTATDRWIVALGSIAVCSMPHVCAAPPPDPGPFAWWSADGSAWQRLPAPTELWVAVDANSERIAATDGVSIWTTTDGLDWALSKAPQPRGEVQLLNIARDPWIAIGRRTEPDKGLFVWRSTDEGRSWQETDADLPDIDVRAMARRDDTVVAVEGFRFEDEPAWASVVISTDGRRWQRRVLDGAIELFDVASAAGGFMAIGRAGADDDPILATWVSSDGLDWERRADIAGMTKFASGAIALDRGRAIVTDGDRIWASSVPRP